MDSLSVNADGSPRQMEVDPEAEPEADPAAETVMDEAALMETLDPAAGMVMQL